MTTDQNGQPSGDKETPRGWDFRGRIHTEASPSALDPIVIGDDLDPELKEVLESAARLQELVPETILVGGSAAAMYARHRLSYDHDHVLRSLKDRFDVVFDALDREGDFVLSRAIPQKIILGELGGIEVGIRQLIRKRPLEVQHVTLPSGRALAVPTEAEIVRIKAYLIVKRNQVRDYLDVAAMSGAYGPERVAGWIRKIDEYYTDDTAPEGAVSVFTQLARQLSNPAPKDVRTLKDFANYKGLKKRWTNWDRVVSECHEVAHELGRITD